MKQTKKSIQTFFPSLRFLLSCDSNQTIFKVKHPKNLLMYNKMPT